MCLHNSSHHPFALLCVFYRYHNIPKETFLVALQHCCLSCRAGKYSLINLLQKTSAKYWTCFHLLWQLISFSSKTLGGSVQFGLNSNMWLGVNGSASAKSVEISQWTQPCTSTWLGIRHGETAASAGHLVLCEQSWSQFPWPSHVWSIVSPSEEDAHE